MKSSRKELISLQWAYTLDDNTRTHQYNFRRHLWFNGTGSVFGGKVLTGSYSRPSDATMVSARSSTSAPMSATREKQLRTSVFQHLHKQLTCEHQHLHKHLTSVKHRQQTRITPHIFTNVHMHAETSAKPVHNATKNYGWICKYHYVDQTKTLTQESSGPPNATNIL